jgi:hypothetical protein
MISFGGENGKHKWTGHDRTGDAEDAEDAENDRIINNTQEHLYVGGVGRQ